jgi:DNA-binding transcriptional ArsR family regulator
MCLESKRRPPTSTSVVGTPVSPTHSIAFGPLVAASKPAWMMRFHASSTRQAISQHLDVLEAAGLIDTRRQGRYKFHYINTGPLERILGRWLSRR